MDSKKLTRKIFKKLRPAIEIVEEMGQMNATPNGKHWTPDMDGMAKLIDKERRAAIRKAIEENNKEWEYEVKELKGIINALEEEFIPFFGV